ncbi:MFS transporter [Bacillus fonticola]|uniref:MFS transporter n=1 Tax=Bacillus fonticola TaxID=2728853 RepID=UPI0014759BEF|nr:MFS transporter [Bacillus fonticola]
MLRQKRQVVLIAFITAVSVLGDAMFIIVLPLYWQKFGLTAIWQIGVLLAVNRLIRLPINPVVGWFYRRYQRRTGFLFAVVLAIVATFSYGVLQGFWLLLLMRAIWGVAWSFLRLGGFLTVLETSDDTNRGHYVGLYNGLWGIGGLVGMLGGGFLVDQTSILFVTTTFAIIGLFAIPAVFLSIPLTVDDQTEEKKSETKSPWLTHQVIAVLLTGLTMGFTIFGVFAATLGQLIERLYVNEWSTAQITIGAATLAGIIQAIRWGWDPFLAPTMGKRLDQSNKKHVFASFALFTGAVLFIFLGTTSSLLFLLLGLIAFQLISTLFVTVIDTLATSVAATTDRIKMMTAHTIVVDVGAALGPLLAFVVIQWGSIAAVYLIAGGWLLVLGLYWVLLFQLRRA